MKNPTGTTTQVIQGLWPLAADKNSEQWKNPWNGKSIWNQNELTDVC